MKKNILLLINGFGIEKAGSYNVYTPSLMPDMDRLTREGIFASIPNNYFDYKSAYRGFSMGVKDSLTYNLIDNNISSNEYQSNQLLRYITNEVNKYKSRLHVVCYWDGERTLEHLSKYLKVISSQTDAIIYLHVVLCQKALSDYKDIDRGFQALNYDLGEKIKLGVITGEDNMTDILPARDIIKCFITEYGEKWKDLSRKVGVFIQTKTPPHKARTFSVNPGYKFEDNDQVLIFNYNNIDWSLFMKELRQQKYRPLNLDSIKFYSMFPVRNDVQIPFMYNYAIASNYLLNSLKTINAKCLVIDKKDNCAYINYYLTGLRNNVDDALKYYPSDDDFIYDSNKLIEIIKSYDKELYIINYEIESCKSVDEMSERLKKIDAVIGALDRFIKENNYGLFITSFYGVEKELYNSKQELCKINFSGRSPLIIDDKEVNKASYSIGEGSLFELSNSILWNIEKKYKNHGLIRKKSSLLSFLYKKPKSDKK